MSESTSERELADQARTALLEGVIRAAESGSGETARNLAEAYVILNDSAPRENKEGDNYSLGSYVLSTRGRR
ncbi:hypothetical protein [Streptomyces sp. SID8352]|uniref:hypothetical protein n=1 Tax=Streptomyces sp. SID8352 TaxID=2690338 RepID=UPI001370B7DC|nr:hypothetical protein [Streptomyces sp. SID8352]MYU21202.1 hypothetical protein [Streptomyces sp. SID8352]